VNSDFAVDDQDLDRLALGSWLDGRPSSYAQLEPTLVDGREFVPVVSRRGWAPCSDAACEPSLHRGEGARDQSAFALRPTRTAPSSEADPFRFRPGCRRSYLPQ
jgi:hypothetical protein